MATSAWYKTHIKSQLPLRGMREYIYKPLEKAKGMVDRLLSSRVLKRAIALKSYHFGHRFV
jgi:hypothetical protein